MGAHRYDQSRRQPVWFSPYLLALVLSPVVLQTSTPLSCGPTGISTLSALEVEVMGTNEIAFDTAQRNYDVWPPVSASTAIVRATSSSVVAQVSYRLSQDGVLIEGGWLGTGSGEVTIPLEPGLSTLRVWGKSDGGASTQYTVAIQVGCSQCSDGSECTADTCDPVEEMCVQPPEADGTWCDFDGLPGLCIAGVCEEDPLCPVLTRVFVTPLQANVGDQINVGAVASGVRPINYLWTATGGSFVDPSSPITEYRCEEAGQQDLTIAISDGTASCTDERTLTVTCLGEP
jgi:hypothetical protein